MDGRTSASLSAPVRDEVPSFEDFFVGATGRQPYVWQRRMAQDLAAGRPPSWLCVPTGMGKTSVMWCWVWALAVDLARCDGLAGARRVPMRLLMVVDRRVVVDDTTRLAHVLAEVVCTGSASRAVAWVAGRLARLVEGEGAGEPLVQVRALRGGMPDRPENVRHPAAPAIITGTIDLIGSRLLWRGYGVNPLRRAIEAALTGIDCLWVLDEAHLAHQLVTTLTMLERQSREEGRLEGAVPARTVMYMTATPPSEADPYMSWDVEIAARQELDARHARRQTTQVRVEASTGTVEQEIVRIAKTVPVEAGRATLLFTNTVRQARAAAAAARRRADLAEGRVVLAIGGMPGRFREDVLAAVAPYRTGTAGRAKAPGLLIVATQTLEVGADIDVDHLVTVVASREALIQRLGRVNRVGDRYNCSIRILVASTQDKDPVYGSAAQAAALALFEAEPTTLSDVVAALHSAEGAGAIAQVPAVLPRHVFEWYLRTAGSDNEPPVSRWLRPVEDPRAEVQVCFRDSVGLIADEHALVSHLDRHPPAPDEVWTVPVDVADALVSGRHALRGVAMDPARETPTRLLTPGDHPRAGALLVVASTTDAFDIPGAGHDLSGPDQFRLCLEADLPETPPFDQVWTVLVCEAGESVGWVDITPARATAEPVPAGGYALDSHLRDVARRAAAWASQLGIHADLLADITAAARLHDEGKRAAPIQQEYSLVVDETGLLIQRQGEASGAALAKSALPRRMWVRARRLVGNPPYLRHEALSAEAVTPSTGNDPDLVRHLVLAHHGYFRGPGPVIAATTFCPAPAYQDSTTVEWRGWPVVFDHLNRRYGPYSLALAETIIRLADWHESRKIS